MAKTKVTEKKQGGIVCEPHIIGRREKEFIASIEKCLDEILRATMVPKELMFYVDSNAVR